MNKTSTLFVPLVDSWIPLLRKSLLHCEGFLNRKGYKGCEGPDLQQESTQLEKHMSCVVRGNLQFL